MVTFEEVPSRVEQEPSNISSRDDAIDAVTIACNILSFEPSAEQLVEFEKTGNLETNELIAEVRHLTRPKYLKDTAPEAVFEREHYGLIYNKKDQRYYYIGLDGKPLVVDFETLRNPNTELRGDDLEFPLVGDSLRVKNKVVEIVEESLRFRLLGYLFKDQSPNTTNIFRSDENSENPLEKLSEKQVKNLPMQDYIQMWQGFSGHYLSHVTRLGVRHLVMAGFHTIGEGQYMDSAFRVLKDGFLQSTMAAYERGTSEYQERFSKWIEDREGFVTEKGKILATNQIHFAHDDVSWDLYGAEPGNVPFFIFPTEIIMAFRTFSNYGFDKLREKSRNDVAVSGNAKDSSSAENQIPLDFGVVFLSKSARVDPKTGSQFELDENWEPKEIEDNIRKLEKLVTHPQSSKMLETITRLRMSPDDLSDYFQQKPQNHPLAEFLRIFDALGFDNEKMPGIVAFLFRAKIPEKYEGRKMEPQELRDLAKECLMRAGILYQRARNTSLAHEFWESQFTKGKLKRPTRIIYYDGDPQEALLEFMSTNKIPQPYDGKPFTTKGRVIDIGVFAHTDLSKYLWRLTKRSND